MSLKGDILPPALPPRKYKPRVSLTPEIVERLCEAIHAGQHLVNICSTDDMPSRNQVSHWLYAAKETPELRDFRERFRAALAAKVALYGEEAIQIADDASQDWVDRGDGVKELNTEHIARTRLRIDTRLSLMKSVEVQQLALLDRVLAASGVAAVSGTSEREKARRLAFALQRGLVQASSPDAEPDV